MDIEHDNQRTKITSGKLANLPLFTLFISLGVFLLLLDKQWLFLSHPSKGLQTKKTESLVEKKGVPSQAILALNERQKQTNELLAVIPNPESEVVAEESPEQLDPGQYDATSPAYDIQICNKSSIEKLYVSIGYFNQISKSWVAKGWFVANNKKCFVPLKNVRPPIYAYAESVNGNARWGVGEQQGKNASFCIDQDNKFTFPRSRCEVEAPGALDALVLDTHSESQGDWRTFTKLNVSGKGGTFTWNLAEP